MQENDFKALQRELEIASITGTLMVRHLVFQDLKRPVLKVYIYKEPNHNRPHVHIYYGKQQQISVCIKTQESLAGQMNSKYLNVIKTWIQRHSNELLTIWSDVQIGNKPELLWAQDESIFNSII